MCVCEYGYINYWKNYTVCVYYVQQCVMFDAVSAAVSAVNKRQQMRHIMKKMCMGIFRSKMYPYISFLYYYFIF